MDFFTTVMDFDFLSWNHYGHRRRFQLTTITKHFKPIQQGALKHKSTLFTNPQQSQLSSPMCPVCVCACVCVSLCVGWGTHQGEQVEEDVAVSSEDVEAVAAEVDEQLEARRRLVAPVDDVSHVRGQHEWGPVSVGGGGGGAGATGQRGRLKSGQIVGEAGWN